MSDLQADEIWLSKTFKKYRKLIILTGGKKSPLYKRYYSRLTKSFKDFRTAIAAFFVATEKELPARLRALVDSVKAGKTQEDVDRRAKRAQRSFAEIESHLRVCRTIQSARERVLKMDRDVATAKKRTQEAIDRVREQLILAAQPPQDAYTGADKKALRARVLAAWQKQWPNDQVVAIRMHMAAFKRTKDQKWDPTTKVLRHRDKSELCVRVIVKTGRASRNVLPRLHHT